MEWDAKQKQRFLTALNANYGFCIAKVCRELKVSRTQAYVTRKVDPDFAAEWDETVEAGKDRLLHSALVRSVEGIETYVVSQGRMVIDPATEKPLTERKYSDSLHALLLKGALPEMFKERHEHDVKVTSARAIVESRIARLAGTVVQGEDTGGAE